MLYHPNRVLRIVLNGSLIFVCLIFALLCHSAFVAGNMIVLERLPFAGLGVCYVLIAGLFYKKRFFTATSWMVIALYGGLAFAILLLWGINAPMGILIMGFVILLAGILLGARLIMPITGGVIGILALLQTGRTIGMITPDHTAVAVAPSFGDVMSYGVMFFIFALISWLSRNQMEQSLQRALAAEIKLEREKELLALRLEKQTKDLKESQLQEMRQLYRFAELGQLSTLLLHDLANHLSVLTMDIDDIEQRHKRSESIMRAKDSIEHLDTMIDQVRQQLHENSRLVTFRPQKITAETIDTLASKASKQHVTIHIAEADKSIKMVGDPLRFSQIVTILVTNAIEAYRDTDTKDAKVSIHIAKTKQQLKMTVSDHGAGISSDKRKVLFQPFQSTKDQGMGIGLFIAKNMVESHFNGRIALDPRTDQTLFHITLPLKTDE